MAQEEARRARARKKKDEKEATEAPSPAKVARPKSRKRATESLGADVVAVRAYLLWEQGEPGDATEHWLRAERELAA